MTIVDELNADELYSLLDKYMTDTPIEPGSELFKKLDMVFECDGDMRVAMEYVDLYFEVFMARFNLKAYKKLAR